MRRELTMNNRASKREIDRDTRLYLADLTMDGRVDVEIDEVSLPRRTRLEIDCAYLRGVSLMPWNY